MTRASARSHPRSAIFYAAFILPLFAYGAFIVAVFWTQPLWIALTVWFVGSLPAGWAFARIIQWGRS